MQAVRLARYHTRPLASGALLRRLSRLVGRRAARRRQPGAGARDLHACRTCPRRRCGCCARGATSPACWSIRCRRCIRTAARRPTPRWSTARRSAHFDRAAYADWLKQLRAVCTERGIVLIFDEVFVGFRLAPGGAQEYFGVRADLVTYGKTLGGGLPVGVRLRPRDLMKRFRDDRPADICFARGTFNSHPYVMGAMNEFLRRSRRRRCARSTRSRRDLERARARAQRAPARRGAAGRRWPTCRRSGRSATRSRRATTGCCNITCAPKGWR